MGKCENAGSTCFCIGFGIFFTVDLQLPRSGLDDLGVRFKTDHSLGLLHVGTKYTPRNVCIFVLSPVFYSGIFHSFRLECMRGDNRKIDNEILVASLTCTNVLHCCLYTVVYNMLIL